MRQREHLSACIREMTMKKTRRLLSKHSDSDTDTCVGCLPPYLIFFLWGGLFFFFFSVLKKEDDEKHFEMASLLL